MTQRIYIAPDRVTVSKPGFDAVSPPAVDYKYLAIDSRLNQGRPLEIGVIPNCSRGLIVPFTTSYAGIPGVDLVVNRVDGSAFDYYAGMVMRDAGSVAYNRTHFYLAVWPNQFQIVDDTQYVTSSLLTSGLAGYYILWQNW
jgi:hypothetical protein